MSNLFENILFEELEKDIQDVEIKNLDESVFALNPMLAFFLLKKDNLEKNVVEKKSIKSKIEKKGRDVKAKAQIGKEKIRSSLGITSGKGEDATVYKFSNDQKEFLKELYKQHGNEIIEDILKFRKEILAPYQLIKRIIKQNRTVSSKEKHGMTHAQFKQAVESGKRKIEKRAKVFQDGGTGKQENIEKINNTINNLEKAKEAFNKNGELKNSYVEKILKNYELDTDSFQGQSLEDLKKTYEELKRINKEIENTSPGVESHELIKRSLELRKGAIKREREDKEEKEEKGITVDNKIFKNNNGSFNAAFGKYLLRRNVVENLRAENNNKYKKMYLGIFDEMREKLIERKRNIISSKSKELTDMEFNEIERKIWKPKPNVGKKYSGDMDDYNQVVKDEDFEDVEYIERPKELIEAEKEIEKEIKKFERNLKKKISDTDFKKLKEMRLINNLVTVKELKKSKEMFKETDKIKDTKEENKKEENKKEEKDEE